MKEKIFQWINDDYKANFTVPESLRLTMEEAEQADLENDDIYFVAIDDISVQAKNAYVSGLITKKQWDILELRYRG